MKNGKADDDDEDDDEEDGGDDDDGSDFDPGSEEDDKKKRVIFVIKTSWDELKQNDMSFQHNRPLHRPKEVVAGLLQTERLNL